MKKMAIIMYLRKGHRTCVIRSTFKDLLIASMFFVFLAAFNASTVTAAGGHFYVAGYDFYKIYQYYGVCGYQNTVSVTVLYGSAVASFVGLGQSNGDFFACGFFQGRDWNNVWHATPTYYVDRVLGGSYAIWTFGEAPTGQNHQYWVFKGSGYGMMNAELDSTIIKQESGYSTYASLASAQTESLDSSNQMNHHFWSLRGAQVELRYYAWTNTQYHVDSPYHQNVISATEWYAYS